MAEVVFVPDVAGWQFAFRSWSGVVGTHMIKVGKKHLLLAKASAPSPGSRPRNRTLINYSTGNLKAQIVNGRGRFGPELEIQTLALPKYSIFVHEGTLPHVITPKRPGGMLKFYWHRMDSMAYFRKVNHPGTRRIPFLAENLREAVKL